MSSLPIPAHPILSCTGVGYTFKSRGGRRALDDVSFSVGKGEIFGVLGPNGSGKTTLFRLLSTLVPLAEGSVRLAGCDYPAEMARARRHFGIVFQSPSLDKKLTVEENLQAHGHLYGLHGAELRERIGSLLERFSLAARRKDIVETLSGGLQRRVEVAKSLVPRPALLILDEPSTGLDPVARRELWDYLRALRRSEGLTLLMTTHFLDEAEWCDRLLVLDRGRRVALDTPEALKRSVSGTILTLRTKGPEPLAAALLERIAREFRVAPLLRDEETLELELPPSASPEAERDLLNGLLRRYRDEIAGLTLAAPSLENVFARLTGRNFNAAEGESPTQTPSTTLPSPADPTPAADAPPAAIPPNAD
ncbi:ABC-2 type transport system ATP-binding protein [Verrucomicrobium sp. GAS474]|uniref:ABC transporter ATP-binding protein n=1 Tax=Verrucomicrobium sp. GAS474 TaxID=1882831 RepID=UPI00087C4DAA|nr:ATP-binding cassette domain-containing protein [Verrucomicrobium sp. GAS474]SDT95986.1 ABC-2 type transport system ATP-binding protein [Verrucomicrobium sp. GAS474]